MKLSIIVPAYNAEETLADCLQSLVGQTVEEKEIIVIDDGSTDRTPEILASFPVESRRVENGGQGRARNIGLSMATGDYIGFVDSDDRAEKDMYEKLLRAAEGEGADIALCDAMGHYPDGRQEPERIWREDRPMAAAGFASNKLCWRASAFRRRNFGMRIRNSAQRRFIGRRRSSTFRRRSITIGGAFPPQ